MIRLLKLAIVATAALLAAEMLAATYVGAAIPAEQPKIATKDQCMKNISVNGSFYIPCSLLMKYDIQAWVESGQEI
jgi:hypothetical protein